MEIKEKILSSYLGTNALCCQTVLERMCRCVQTVQDAEKTSVISRHAKKNRQERKKKEECDEGWEQKYGRRN